MFCKNIVWKRNQYLPEHNVECRRLQYCHHSWTESQQIVTPEEFHPETHAVDPIKDLEDEDDDENTTDADEDYAHEMFSREDDEDFP